MAYVTYHRTDTVHASRRRLAWGRLTALAATFSLWAGLIAGVRAVF